MTTPQTPVSLDELPGPRGLPLVGNVFDIDTADPLGGFVRMAEEYARLAAEFSMGAWWDANGPRLCAAMGHNPPDLSVEAVEERGAL